MKVSVLRFNPKQDPVRRAIAVRHRKMKNVKVGLECTIAGLVFGLMPYIRTVANEYRGYDGIGSEILFPFVALAAYILIELVVDEITAELDAKDVESLE